MTQPTPSDFGAAIADGLRKQILIRLQADHCEHCGRSSTDRDLELARKFLVDSEIRALRVDATQSVLDAQIELPFTAPLYLPETPPT